MLRTPRDSSHGANLMPSPPRPPVTAQGQTSSDGRCRGGCACASPGLLKSWASIFTSSPMRPCCASFSSRRCLTSWRPGRLGSARMGRQHRARGGGDRCESERAARMALPMQRTTRKGAGRRALAKTCLRSAARRSVSRLALARASAAALAFSTASCRYSCACSCSVSASACLRCDACTRAREGERGNGRARGGDEKPVRNLRVTRPHVYHETYSTRTQ